MPAKKTSAKPVKGKKAASRPAASKGGNSQAHGTGEEPLCTHVRPWRPRLPASRPLAPETLQPARNP